METTYDEILELQNRTQPLPRTLIEMAQAEMGVNLSTGTSVFNKKMSQTSNNAYNKNISFV